MQNSDMLFIAYDIQWFVWAGLLCGAVLGWGIAVIVLTRRRRQKTLAALSPQVPVMVDSVAIKQKYIGMIQDIVTRHAQGTVTVRAAHQELSGTVRRFVREISGARFEVMTLTDIKQSRYSNVATVIEVLYSPEFMRENHGDVQTAARQVQEVVQSWA